MSSIKLILFKGKKYSDDTHPIMLQYINGREIKRKVVYKCIANDWDPKNNRLKSKAPGSAYINNYLSEVFAEAEKDLFKIHQGEAVTIKFLEGTTNMTVAQAIEKEQARLKKLLKPTSHDQLNSWLKQMGHLADTPVTNANINWFNSLIDKFKGLGNQPATLQKKIKHIRRIIDKHSDIELSKEVKNIKISAPKPIKQKLNTIELDLIVNACLPEGKKNCIVRDIFLLQVYLRGIRIGDMLQATNEQFSSIRFNYKSDKTGKEMSIKLTPQASAIVDKYKGKYQCLFPFFNWEYDSKLSEFDNKRNRLKQKESCTTLVNNSLKQIAKLCGITKPLSSHIARHTFARMAIDKVNNPMVTMELLGHSSLAIHQAYLNDIRKDDVLDAAADDIFGL